MTGDLFDWAFARLVREARARPYAHAGAASKRLRKFVTAQLRAEVTR